MKMPPKPNWPQIWFMKAPARGFIITILGLLCGIRIHGKYIIRQRHQRGRGFRCPFFVFYGDFLPFFPEKTCGEFIILRFKALVKPFAKIS
jgi:hypothetical protein